jgi:hypothetical protein
MADEFDQYKVTATPVGDEFAQYKVPTPTAPGTITGNIATIGQAPSSYQPTASPKGEGEGFIDRTTSRFGQNLESAGQAILHPINTLSAMLSAKGDNVGPLDALPAQFEQYKKDPANLAGDVMTALVAKTVGGSPPGINMAEAGKSLPIPVVRPAPLWQSAGIKPTTPGFDWQGSTPEEIKAQLTRMANRAKTVRPEGAPVDAHVPEPTVQPVPLPNIAPTKAATVDPYRRQILPPMTKGISGNVEAHAYNPASQEMIAHFKSGDIYRYEGVPQKVYDQFVNAESQGSFHYNNIRGRYTTTKIGKVAPTRNR